MDEHSTTGSPASSGPNSFSLSRQTRLFHSVRDKDELLAVRTRALTDGNGSALSPITPWTSNLVNTLYALSDSSLSVVAFVSPSGRIRESRLYDAYGNLSRHLLGDLNADGLVDDTDFGIFNAAYDLYDCAGTAGGDASAGMLGNTLTKWGCPADLNGDWVVDDADFTIFAAGYNQMIPEQDALVSGNAAGGAMLWGPGWTGAWYDPATGLWLSRNRWYDPLAGRWNTRDPAGYVDGLSLYLYVKGNPFLFRDPSGLAPDSVMDQRAFAGRSVLAPLATKAGEAINTPTGQRVLGGIEAAGGAAEMAIGVAASSTGIGAIVGVPAIVHGADHVQAGVRSVISGQHTDTFTKKGIETGLSHLGASPETASAVATLGDAGLGVGFSLGAGIAASKNGLVTVMHFTDQQGLEAIQGAKALRSGTYVTVPEEVQGLNAAQVEAALEIQPGRGAFSTTLSVKKSSLVTPANGELTSGSKVQFQLSEPAKPGAFVPTTCATSKP
ncbi:MAG: RHS repeat-associated core domain-containing protein [Phycisphaerales bacterium]